MDIIVCVGIAVWLLLAIIFFIFPIVTVKINGTEESLPRWANVLLGPPLLVIMILAAGLMFSILPVALLAVVILVAVKIRKGEL